MKNKEMIAKLQQYNPEAEFEVVAYNRVFDFSITYGNSEGCTKENCDKVGPYIDELCTNEQANNWPSPLPKFIAHRPDEACYVCHEKTESLAANPTRWPVYLPFIGGNGKTRAYHTQCVVLGLQLAEDVRKADDLYAERLLTPRR